MRCKRALNAILAVAFVTFVESTAWNPMTAAADTFAPDSRLRASSRVQEQRLRLFVSPEYSSVTRKSQTLSGFGFGAGAVYGLSSSWGAGSSFRQGFSGAGFSANFTEIDLRLTYALTGSLILKQETLSLGGDPVVEAHPYSPGGLRAELALTQYFFNSAQGSLPFTGGGVGLAYELPSRTPLSFSIGVRMDQISNGQITLSPKQMSIGVLLWM